MRRLILLPLLIALAMIALGVAPETDARASDPHRVVRGMTISCPGSGQIWGTDAMVESMAELKSLGVNWIAIHPYAGIRPDGTVSISRRRGSMYDDPTWLTRPIAEAQRLGLKIMIKPHIAYWGSPFSWRGDITFDTQEQWDRFFSTYEEWILLVAGLSKDADAFVVGTELDRTIQHDAAWRSIIGKIRTTLPEMPLTYAANWDRFEQVKFWDALDVIGIQGYFPLVGHSARPDAEELRASWARLVGRLETFAKKHRRDIILAELGYNRSSRAASHPWEYQTGGEHADEIQRACLEVALAAIEESDRITGAFLWKWFPGRPHTRGNFLMNTPPMRDVISNAWDADD